MKFFQSLSGLHRLSCLLILALALSACGGGDTASGADGGIIATGRALVSGNVASSSLPGDLNNISVNLKERATSTNAAGEFSLGDVAAGEQEIIFSKGGETASLALAIQSQSQTTLNNIHINEKTVTTDKVEVEDHTPLAKNEDEDEQNAPETENEDKDKDDEIEESEQEDDEDEPDDEKEDPEENEPKDDEK